MRQIRKIAVVAAAAFAAMLALTPPDDTPDQMPEIPNVSLLAAAERANAEMHGASNEIQSGAGSIPLPIPRHMNGCLDLLNDLKALHQDVAEFHNTNNPLVNMARNWWALNSGSVGPRARALIKFHYDQLAMAMHWEVGLPNSDGGQTLLDPAKAPSRLYAGIDENIRLVEEPFCGDFY
jgi:hypothetical protein